jgi:hypothetical protein
MCTVSLCAQDTLPKKFRLTQVCDPSVQPNESVHGLAHLRRDEVSWGECEDAAGQAAAAGGEDVEGADRAQGECGWCDVVARMKKPFLSLIPL